MCRANCCSDNCSAIKKPIMRFPKGFRPGASSLPAAGLRSWHPGRLRFADGKGRSMAPSTAGGSQDAREAGEELQTQPRAEPALGASGSVDAVGDRALGRDTAQGKGRWGGRGLGISRNARAQHCPGKGGNKKGFGYLAAGSWPGWPQGLILGNVALITHHSGQGNGGAACPPLDAFKSQLNICPKTC